MMPPDPELADRARQAFEGLKAKKLSVVTAESCTAGLLAALLSEAPGAAKHLHGGYVTYTKANKTKTLGVSPELLARHGAVCREVALLWRKERLSGLPQKWRLL
jgi:nicotinamide-nucleotide amidase